MIFSLGCMIAESAVTEESAVIYAHGEVDILGLRITLLASARSTMTTWFVSFTFSRLQRES